MNKLAILHIPDSRYCFATGNKELVIRLRMAREDEAVKVSLIHACKYDFWQKRDITPMEICYTDQLYNYYEIKLELADVRFAYLFQFEEDGKKSYYSEDGVTDTYNFQEGFYNFFQMPYINSNDCLSVVEWMRSAVFYQIFVERFCRGNYKKDDSYITQIWGEKPTPKSFSGGDIAGIIDRLDYIKELGINAIYLTPVFKSISNHKYDISDYKMVDPQFGTNEELKTLVRRSHEKGMRVVLDAVFNHCSMDMEQFQDVLRCGNRSKYYKWFIIDGDYPEPEQLNYECFASCNYMPKLNTAEPEVQDFLIEIALYWIKEADIDGWRLDVSDEVSHDFWRKFRQAVKKEKEDCVIIGENWHDAYPYLQGDQYDSIMNYSFTKACLDYFAKDRFNSKDMAEKLNGNLMRNMEQVNYMMLNLLDSHDTHRFFTEVGKDKNKLVAAIALTIMFPGAPCIYYGTEICMEGGYDPDSRRCFDWHQSNWDKEVWELIKGLISLRNSKILQYGNVKISEKDEMLQLVRRHEDKILTLLINPTNDKKIFSSDKSKILFSNRTDGDQINANGFIVMKGEA